MADFDALFWDRLPVEERAEALWELSEELHAIAHPETHAQPGRETSLRRCKTSLRGCKSAYPGRASSLRGRESS